MSVHEAPHIVDPTEPSSDADLRITVARVGDALIVRLGGELDLAAAAEVEGALSAVEPPPAVTVLDLEQLGFIDSSGLNLIVRAHRRARADGRQLVVAGLRGPVLATFQALRLDTAVPVAPDAASVLAEHRR